MLIKKLKMALIIRIVIISLAFYAFFIMRSFAVIPDFRSAQLLPSPKPIIGFTLENQEGNIFTSANFNQHWNLVFFGFTHCPDMCPLELQELSKVLKMAELSDQIHLQVVFISLDPERDTRETVAKYLAAFSPDIIGLRGANKDLANLNHSFAADYHRSAILAGSPLNIPAGINMPSDVNNTYQVDHSGRIYIVNPKGQYIGSFPFPHDAKKIWTDLQLILKR